MNETPPLRLVVMGTGPFAVPLFRALCASRHVVAALVTQPPRENRGKPLTNPMRSAAEELGREVYAPDSVNVDEARRRLASYEPDLFVVADYGQILKPETLAVARLGGINLHGSLLPKYRGAAPINWALLHGDDETGVTVIQMSPRVDAGGCLLQARTPIGPDEDAVALERRLAESGAPLVVEAVERLSRGTLAPAAQDSASATPARRLKKSDGEVDWTRSAQEIRNQVRGLKPWPRTSTELRRDGAEPLRVLLEQVEIADVSPPAAVPLAANARGAASTAASPGTIVAAADDGISVATGDGVLIVRALQPAGKRLMSAGEFLRGHPAAPGSRFGSS